MLVAETNIAGVFKQENFGAWLQSRFHVFVFNDLRRYSVFSLFGVIFASPSLFFGRVWSSPFLIIGGNSTSPFSFQGGELTSLMLLLHLEVSVLLVCGTVF